MVLVMVQFAMRPVVLPCFQCFWFSVKMLVLQFDSFAYNYTLADCFFVDVIVAKLTKNIYGYCWFVKLPNISNNIVFCVSIIVAVIFYYHKICVNMVCLVFTVGRS